MLKSQALDNLKIQIFPLTVEISPKILYKKAPMLREILNTYIAFQSGALIGVELTIR